MTTGTIISRWQAAAGRAAQSTLADRWRSTMQDLMAAREQYRELRDAPRPNVSAVRKAAQRMHDLDQLRGVLTRELQDLPE